MFYLLCVLQVYRGKACQKMIKDLPSPRSLIETDVTGEMAPSHISIPQPYRSMVPIPTLEVDEPSKMLGVYICPAGEGIKHVGWLDRLQTKPLPTKDVWLSFFLQLYPGMSWGLPTIIMPPNKLEQEFQQLYYKCLSKLGVNRCITREWRMLSPRCLGFGM